MSAGYDGALCDHGLVDRTASVTFSITDPAGVVTTMVTVSDFAGIAIAMFTPHQVGSYEVTATFAGDAALTPATATASFVAQ